MIRNQSSLSPRLGRQRQRQRQRRRSEEKKSCTPATLPSMNGVAILLLLVALCSCATRCSSFQTGGPILRVQRTAGRVGNPLQHRASVAVMAVDESQKGGDQDRDDERKKRVPITIRYSAESGLKPYYLTVAKRVKDAYPDVFIERVEIDDGPTDNAGDPSHPGGTFEVIVDGKLVVRTRKVSGSQRGCVVFVSMSEMDAAITRARKRRRPSTVYGEHGMDASYDALDGKDRMVKARLEALKQKATELQRTAQRLDEYASASASATADE